MIELTINGKKASVEDGGTVLRAARKLGVRVPTLCHRDGDEFFTSCMVCVVKDLDSGELVPACSALARDGMRIETDSPEIVAARRQAIELLLSEHVGDCEAPCRMVCPAYMNVPRMLREIRDRIIGDGRALAVVREHIAFPSLTGRLCHAPCEKACRRGRRDQPVAIKVLERLVADLELDDPSVPEQRESNGKSVAVVGAGPTGMAVAHYLARAGTECLVHDRNENAGGALRGPALADHGLDPVLDAETDRLRRMGVKFRFGSVVGKDGETTVAQLRERHAAVVVAVGPINPATAGDDYGLPVEEKGFKVDYDTFACDEDGVFAGGDAVVPMKQVVRAMADGKSIADSVLRLFAGNPAGKPKPEAFNCRFGKLLDGDMEEFMKEGDDVSRWTGKDDGATMTAEAAARCIHCDCRAAENCELRDRATEYGAKRNAYAGRERSPFKKNDSHPEIIFEPGKCVKCGRCVRITATYSDASGLAFSGRGFDTGIVVPFMERLEYGVRGAAGECVAACPTGALAWKRN